MAKTRVEKPYAGGRYSNAKFFGMIRSAIRRIQWPPKYDALKAAKRELKEKKGNQRFEYRCAECRGWFKGKEVELDHITPCGSLRTWEDVVPFIQRALCEADGFRVLCRTCHRTITNEQRRTK